MNNSQEEWDLIAECPSGGLHNFVHTFYNGKRLLGRYHCSKCGWKHTKQSERQPLYDAAVIKAREEKQRKSILNKTLRLLRIIDFNDYIEKSAIQRRLDAI